MSFAAVFIKILSAIYRIPYQNIAGDIGFYVYQQIYPLYGIAITLSTFGFPVIISKFISENKYERSMIIKNAFFGLLLIGTLVFVLVYSHAAWLATVMGDQQLKLPIQTIAFIFFIIPFLSVLRGFFQGQEEMLPTAISQVTEQFSRVCAILVLTYIFVTNGYGPYVAGTGAALGSIFGGVIGSLVLLMFYVKQKGRMKQRKNSNSNLSLKIIFKVVYQGVLICFSSLILIIFQFIDALTVLRGLVENGMDVELAKVAKGVFDRGQPLIQMGTVITTSFSLVMVPLIAKVSMEGRLDLIQKYSKLAFQISLLLGAAASVGLAVIIEPANIMLFKDNTDSMVLAVMGLAILFTSIFLTTSAILQGLDLIPTTVLHVLVGALVKAALNFVLIPDYGTLGAAVATVVACSVCASLNIYKLRRVHVLGVASLVRGLKLTLALAIMGIVTYFWKEIAFGFTTEEILTRIGHAAIALSSVTVGAMTFLIVIVVTKLVNVEDLEHVPKIQKLAALMQFRK